MSDPVTLMGELNDLAAALDEASRQLYKLQRDFDKTAELYDDTFNDLLVALLDRYEEEDKKLPGEDVRNALVTKQLRDVEPELFGHYRRLRNELNRGNKRAKRIETQITAKQSVLSYLKTEASAISS